jgi:hypothetical protein
VVRLAESHPELEPEEWSQASFPFPPLPKEAPQPADVLGVRLRAADEKLARRQWQELLGGECRAERGALVFRWPDSPLAVRVELDPGGDEGALGIEIAASRLTSEKSALGVRWLEAGV